ncbi:FMN-binding negative transcriptional regulator [Sphingomonas sp. HITSZ_GF]|uniref:FMN-binding negative transcriptional regulator n=1 Tax=Sphingomonas sp. HITSZ_GF TaxID=3037247 RepID=UPI00240DE692|nr:FMN-binding negative transcriptional regulator [Sphingomonas sp. HITSZ_GF]MDG2535036.1 FMN-binding negative transcriptional regulator [Sphingomonas sp. HITSZ_GF]
MPTHPAFRWEDRPAIRDFVRDLGFGALFVATPDGPRVVHVPVVWLDDTTLGFHLARGNGLVRHIEGATGLFAVQGPDAYISPDWYQSGPNQVPTWNYVTVELEGAVTRTDEAGLIAILDAISQEHERRLAPKPEWTRGKMDPAIAAKMATAIIGYRLEVQDWRGTLKLGQNKPDAARLAAANALDAQGRRAMAALMRGAK